MKSFFKTLLYLLVLFAYESSAYSLSDNQIKEICQKKLRRSNCIRNLRIKKLNLLEGNRIEIPVIPFKNKEISNFKL